MLAAGRQRETKKSCPGHYRMLGAARGGGPGRRRHRHRWCDTTWRLVPGHTRACWDHLPPSPPLTPHGPSAPLTPPLRTDPPAPVTSGTVTWHCDLPDEGHHINTVRRTSSTRRCPRRTGGKLPLD
ncbi:hypothetical protein E2C01_041506 [Portunus trituberculatus]|uniref:Uncharacterized protein n=1 Tax=Portunus trituberculatus TaxID=210409 RepID=A0A5B7FJF2_PORTR|nr:hypothetical protein [Portunus trituberculatus]